jgi:hypothetical protein
MSVLAELSSIQDRYTKVLAVFKEFESQVGIATTRGPLRGVKVLNSAASESFFDVEVAGQLFRLACSLQHWNSTYGLITCHSLDQFTHKVSGTVNAVRFSPNSADVMSPELSESMQTAAGAANIVASLTLPHFKVQSPPVAAV